MIHNTRRDGLCKFGTTGLSTKHLNNILDVILAESSTDEVCQTNFIIKYRPEHRGYFLKDMGEGTGTFVRLDHPYVNIVHVNKLFRC